MRVRRNTKRNVALVIYIWASSPEGGFGVEKVFLFLCAGTLLDLLLADFITPLSVSSSPSAGPETLIIEALSKLQTTVNSSSCQSCHKVALVGSFPCRLQAGGAICERRPCHLLYIAAARNQTGCTGRPRTPVPLPGHTRPHVLSRGKKKKRDILVMIIFMMDREDMNTPPDDNM